MKPVSRFGKFSSVFLTLLVFVAPLTGHARKSNDELIEEQEKLRTQMNAIAADTTLSVEQKSEKIRKLEADRKKLSNKTETQSGSALRKADRAAELEAEKVEAEKQRDQLKVQREQSGPNEDLDQKIFDLNAKIEGLEKSVKRKDEKFKKIVGADRKELQSADPAPVATSAETSAQSVEGQVVVPNGTTTVAPNSRAARRANRRAPNGKAEQNPSNQADGLGLDDRPKLRDATAITGLETPAVSPEKLKEISVPPQSQGLQNKILTFEEECWKTSSTPFESIVFHHFEKGGYKMSDAETKAIYDQVKKTGSDLDKKNKKIGAIRAVASSSQIPFRTAGKTEKELETMNAELAQDRAMEALNPYHAALFNTGVKSQMVSPNFEATLKATDLKIRGKAWGKTQEDGTIVPYSDSEVDALKKKKPNSAEIKARWELLKSEKGEHPIKDLEQLTKCCSANMLDLEYKPYQYVTIQIFESQLDATNPECAAIGSSNKATEAVAQEKVKPVLPAESPTRPIQPPPISSVLEGAPSETNSGEVQ